MCDSTEVERTLPRCVRRPDDGVVPVWTFLRGREEGWYEGEE